MIPPSSQDVLSALDVLQMAVHSLVTLYCSAFLPGYHPVWEEKRDGEREGEEREREEVTSLSDQMLRIKVAALHRVAHQEFQK